eukprot:6049136-Karenia_brevis.AAC.1
MERHQVDANGSRPTNPRNAVQRHGGLADVWYLDDGTAFMNPSLVLSDLRAYDRVTHEQGRRRNTKKTRVILYASQDQIEAHAAEWNLEA